MQRHRKPNRRRRRPEGRAGEATSIVWKPRRRGPLRAPAERTWVEVTSKSRVWLPAIGRRSLITFVAFVILLLGPWPGYGRAFGVLFSGYANAVVRIFGISGTSEQRFTPAPSEPREVGGEWTVALSLRDSGDHEDANVPLDTRILGYTPIAVFMALTLASVVSLRRKGIIFGIGLGLLLVRLALAIALPVALAFHILRANSSFGQIAAVAWSVFIDQPAMSYAAPMLAWWIGLSVTTPRTNVEPG